MRLLTVVLNAIKGQRSLLKRRIYRISDRGKDFFKDELRKRKFVEVKVGRGATICALRIENGLQVRLSSFSNSFVITDRSEMETLLAANQEFQQEEEERRRQKAG